MIVTCPACSTRYLVDPRALGNAGRTVRCAQCAETWHQTPPEDFAPPPDLRELVAEPGFASGEETPVGGGRAQLPAVIKPRRPWVAIVAIGLLAVILATLVAGVIARDQAMAMWPSSMKLFAMIGLQPSSPYLGLVIRPPNTKRGSENGVAALIIDGEVANVSPFVRDVPRLTAVLRDGNGKNLESWDFAAAETRLPPGGVATFHTAISQPSAAAAKAVVGFAASE
jgi:predicted Zn finger-like uncharacterized protein